MALKGDSSVRRIEDIGSQANQFAMAKAIASGDPRLLQKAGLESDVARLLRLRAAHFDDQHAVRRTVADSQTTITACERRIRQIEADIERRRLTRGDAFTMEVEGRTYSERKDAGAALLRAVRGKLMARKEGDWTLGAIGGFEISASSRLLRRQGSLIEISLDRAGYAQAIDCDDGLTALGIVSRLEHQLTGFEAELIEQRRILAETQRRLPAYQERLGRPFALAAELEAKRAELAAIDASLAATTTDTPPTAA
jgi:hypothetical protein